MSPREWLVVGSLALSVPVVVWLAVTGGPAGTPRPLVFDQFPYAERVASPDPAERAAAERELLARGSAGLALLPAPELLEDPTARAAVARLRGRLEAVAAEQARSAPLRASRVAFSKATPFGEVAGEIETQGGNRFRLAPAQADRPVDLTVIDRPFWEAVDEAARQAGLVPDGRVLDEHGVRGLLAFRDRGPADEAVRVAYSGPLRISAGPVTLLTSLDEGGRGVARVRVAVLAEPRLRPLWLTFAGRDFSLTAGGAALTPTDPGPRAVPARDGGHSCELDLDFGLPPGGLRGPARLTGRAVVVAAAAEAWLPIEFHPDSPREVSNEGVTARFRKAERRDDGTAEVEALLLREDEAIVGRHRDWVPLTARIGFVPDPEGTRFLKIEPSPDFPPAEDADGGVVLRYRFEGIPAEAASVGFDLRTPGRVVEVPADLTVDGLPLENE